MDQIDPYNVPELFRGVPRPKNHSKKYQKVIKIILPNMEKRIFLKSARTKTVDSHKSIDSIGSIDCIDSIESEDEILIKRRILFVILTILIETVKTPKTL